MAPFSSQNHTMTAPFAGKRDFVGNIGWGVDRPEVTQFREARQVIPEPCKTSFDLTHNQDFLYTRGESTFQSGSKAAAMVLAYSRQMPELDTRPVPNYMLAIHKRFKSPDLAARAQHTEFSIKKERSLIKYPHLSATESNTQVKLVKQFHLTSYSNPTISSKKAKTLTPQESYYNWTRAPNFPPRAGSLLRSRLEKHSS